LEEARKKKVDFTSHAPAIFEQLGGKKKNQTRERKTGQKNIQSARNNRGAETSALRGDEKKSFIVLSEGRSGLEVSRRSENPHNGVARKEKKQKRGWCD